MAAKKIKVLTISDHPLLPSGVGTQTKYIIEALLETGNFEIVSLAGAIKHDDYRPVRIPEWGENWTLIPTDGYANPDILRSALRQHRPDILYFMTDPRFYEWLWMMESEVRESVPMIYYHVWDNYPYPTYNGVWYKSNDFIASISKVTSDIVRTVAPEVEEKYIPHAVDPKFFFKRTDTDSLRKISELRKSINAVGKTVFVWNNRNARRKQPGSLLFWFKKFLDKVGHDKALLVMHTDLRDQHGQPLDYLADSLGLNQGQIVFSTAKLTPEDLALMYNMADCTLNISDAEGFGLGTLESLACGTPIIVNMTGGLQEQITDGENYFGVGLKPASKAIIGSLQVPYIREDRINEDEFVDALEYIHNMSPSERDDLGKLGIEHVIKNYNFDNFKQTWVKTMTDLYEKNGSWENRKNYSSWKVTEI